MVESLTIIAFEVGLCSILAILGVARNRVFSDNSDTPQKNCEKPGFFGCMRGPKPGKTLHFNCQLSRAIDIIKLD
ncbi:MAG: hypothetical protein EA000_12585 [Oscillatoriales cyanobacterium]|nr:MAG: hypothetical protein EA000_12585 [Oscillatoriales cyanobacterium]TAE06450.1 MAG: hypothetical protein EAZ96_02360 [Oscillatoriales cyanobacterium]